MAQPLRILDKCSRKRRVLSIAFRGQTYVYHGPGASAARGIALHSEHRGNYIHKPAWVLGPKGTTTTPTDYSETLKWHPPERDWAHPA